MKSDAFAFEGATFYSESALIDKGFEQLSVVHYFVIPAQCRVFVFDSVETVRTGGYYFGYLIVVEYLDVHHCLHLEEKFIACTFGRVAGATLFGAEYSKAHTCFLQEVGKGSDDAFSSVVKTTSTAYPEEYFGGFATS